MFSPRHLFAQAPASPASTPPPPPPEEEEGMFDILSAQLPSVAAAAAAAFTHNFRAAQSHANSSLFSLFAPPSAALSPGPHSTAPPPVEEEDPLLELLRDVGPPPVMASSSDVDLGEVALAADKFLKSLAKARDVINAGAGAGAGAAAAAGAPPRRGVKKKPHTQRAKRAAKAPRVSARRATATAAKTAGEVLAQRRAAEEAKRAEAPRPCSFCASSRFRCEREPGADATAPCVKCTTRRKNHPDHECTPAPPRREVRVCLGCVITRGEKPCDRRARVVDGHASCTCCVERGIDCVARYYAGGARRGQRT